MKRLSIILIVGIIVSSMVIVGIGCKGQAVAETEEATETEEVTETEEATEVKNVADKVEIEIIDWAPGGVEVWESIDEAFMAEYPNITVKHENYSYADCYQKYGAYISAGEGPDLMPLEPLQAVRDYPGVFIPLKEYLADILDDYNGLDEFSEDADVSKELYGMPISLLGHVIYYNKTVFEEAGLDPENPPLTWSEMDNAIKAIHEIGKVGITHTGIFWAYCNLMNEYLTEDEYEKIITDNYSWNDSGLKNTVALGKWMYDNNWFNEDLASISWDESIDLFMSDGAGFIWGIIGDAYHWKKYGEDMGYDNFGVMKCPVVEENYPLEGFSPGKYADKMDLYGSLGISIPVWSEHVEEAITYIKFITSKDVAEKLLIEGGIFPSNKNVDPLVVEESPQFSKIVEWANEPGKIPCMAVYLHLPEWDAVERQFDLLTEGDTDIDGYIQAMEIARKEGKSKTE